MAMREIIDDMIDAAYFAGVNDTKMNFQNLLWEMDAPCFTQKIQEAVKKVEDYREGLEEKPERTKW